jgi:hypothetical protein
LRLQFRKVCSNSGSSCVVFLVVRECAAVLIAVVGVGLFFLVFLLFGYLTQNPNLSQGLRVEYLHNLSTRIVVVG